ncbi:hypothetical protein ACE41H_22620 [Paenibacillus enshidis]|uniref:Uncharacterized protein n=1 Tax=Paenibacillus enshidis TaxID=1458439 RepID=A0ABV5AZB0_9BACL
MKENHRKVIRGKFRFGENAFPSSKEKREKIMRDVERINRKSVQKKKGDRE